MLIGFAGDKFFYVWMVHPQYGHVGAAAAAALGNLSESMIIYP
jgi:hypothetical protein